MANKTGQQSKSERAQALMREQQRKEKIRNLLVVGAVVVAVLIIGATMFVISSNKDTTGQKATQTPSNLTGTYNVEIGQPSAPHTIKIYEDFQCPICAEFEKVVGSKIRAGIADGKVKVDYHLVSFLDGHSANAYSSRALNAAMAVLSTAGTDAFLKFHEIAYNNQPQEGTAGPDDATLVNWAVQAGAKESQVKPLIDGNVYHQWTVNATGQMSKDGVNGTPTVFIDGKNQGPNPGLAIQNLQPILQ